jgi:SAM-dependent methyltransferase
MSLKRTFQKVQCVELPVSVERVVDDAYWAVNADAKASGLTAAEHFDRYGRAEGRVQAVNQISVEALREEKLRRVRFSASLHRSPGAAANVLTDDLRREFRIPDHPPVSNHEYGGFIEDMLRASPDKLFLDVGSGLRPAVYSNMINMDIYAAVSTDVVGVGEHLPFEDDQFDFILCGAVLEHTRRPWDVAREMCRVLKPGGTVRVDWPFISPVHGYPSHYFNATPEGAISLFERYCDLEYSVVGSNNHPIQGLWWILSVWQNGLTGSDREMFENLTVREILSRAPGDQIDTPYCRNLDASSQRFIPAGSTMQAIKKAGLKGVPDDLQAEIVALRQSSSWRITAPLRRLARLLGRG